MNRLIESLGLVLALAALVVAQGNGHGNGNGGGGNGGGGSGGGGSGGGGSGGGAAELNSPLILAYSNQVPTFPTSDLTFTYFDAFGNPSSAGSNLRNGWPDQFEPDGSNRALAFSVSPMGDVTHGGGARWVLDVRLEGHYDSTTDPLRGNALIAIEETVGAEANPTWYYVPAEDDGPGGDTVLAYPSTSSNAAASSYWFARAAWATAPIGGVMHLAFEGGGPDGAGGNMIGVFAGQVPWNGGPAGPLINIVPIKSGGTMLKWGTATELVFMVPGATNDEIWYADLASGTVTQVPITATPVTSRPHPALSRDGRHIAYVDGVAGRNEILVHDRLNPTAASVQVTNPSRANLLSIIYPEWSPDDGSLAFLGRKFSYSSSTSVYKIKVSGNTKAKKLTSSKVVTGTVVGHFVPGDPHILWRQ